MFWALVLEPGKKYAQTVSKPFHISMASLDVVHSENELVTVNVNFQNAEFILCNLQKNKILQTSLDLNFEAGDRIAFYTSGKGRVHLTGYLIDDDDVDDDLDIDAEAEESEEDVTPQKNAIKANKQEKRKSVGQTPGKPVLKKSKMDSEDEDGDDDGDDFDDDGDSDLESLGDSDEEMEVESEEDDGEEDEDTELEETPPQKHQQGKKKEKQSAQKQLQDKQTNTPNEMKKKKNKGHDAATPNTPTVQANGTPETQSGKKNKKKGGETPGDKGANTPKPPQAGSPQTPRKKLLEGGVAVEDTVVGSGPVAKPGRFVTVYYTGRLKQNNKKFDETVQGPGFKFRLGKGEVIKGWDIGVTGMKVGGKRKLIIPPHMAYGAKGSPPVIPPNSALVFEVELKNVN
uniref:FK506-binding protein n=1 Tax=Locusta migratoria manilensis TaxID=229990 RepID=A0A977IVS0_LOCMI|nr:FK506 binding protein [Locusta migratoria manilensis]